MGLSIIIDGQIHILCTCKFLNSNPTILFQVSVVNLITSEEIWRNNFKNLFLQNSHEIENVYAEISYVENCFMNF